MRKVVKDLNDIPTQLVSQDAIDSLQNIIDRKDKSLIESDIYRGKYVKPDGSTGDAVVEKLQDIYHGKCAYCEERTPIYQYTLNIIAQKVECKVQNMVDIIGYVMNGQTYYLLAMNVIKLVGVKQTYFL